MEKFTMVLRRIGFCAKIVVAIAFGIWACAVAIQASRYSWDTLSLIAYTGMVCFDIATATEVFDKIRSNWTEIKSFFMKLRSKKSKKQEEIELLNKQITDLKAEIESLKTE